jgi:hypothetical protein
MTHISTDYCQSLSIATDEYSYRLLSTVTVVKLVTKKVINVRTCNLYSACYVQSDFKQI